MTTTLDGVLKALEELQAFVDKQAEDEGLWFIAETIAEDYVMRGLRELHTQVEKSLTEVLKSIETGDST